jgi:hypothetical protein
MRTFRFCCKKYLLKNISGIHCTELKVTANTDWIAWWIYRDSQVRYCHYRITNGPPRSETTAGQKKVAHHALGDKAKIYLCSQHVHLGLIKVSVKPVDKDSKGIGYIRQTFSEVSEAKMID